MGRVATPVATWLQDQDAPDVLPAARQLRAAAVLLRELARGRPLPECAMSAGLELAVVARWLLCVAAGSRHAAGPADCCECGVALAHVAGSGVSAVLCPDCDAERLAELEVPDDAGEPVAPMLPRQASLSGELCLSIELAQLGRETARDAWVEHAGELDAIPRYPEWRAWSRLGAALGLLESNRVLNDGERRVFLQAYRNELRALAGGAP